jgi:hypothetical protein
MIEMKHGVGADSGGIATCTKFGRHLFVGFGSSGSQIFMFAIDPFNSALL